MEEEKIVIEITHGAKTLRFAPTLEDYNRYTNEFTLDNKVAPAHAFCLRIAHPEDQEDVREILRKPGAALRLASLIEKEYAPDLEFTVKKSSAAAKK